MQTEAISGVSRNYQLYDIKNKLSDRNTSNLSENPVNIKTLRRCTKCGKYMMINKITKEEWCEYCDRA